MAARTFILNNHDKNGKYLHLGGDFLLLRHLLFHPHRKVRLLRAPPLLEARRLLGTGRLLLLPSEHLSTVKSLRYELVINGIKKVLFIEDYSP